MEAAVAKASAPEEPAPLSGDGGGQVSSRWSCRSAASASQKATRASP